MTVVPLCFDCKHLTRLPTGDLPPGPLRCTAFPREIPQDIQLAEFDHRKPHPGDHGIQFEPAAQKKDRR